MKTSNKVLFGGLATILLVAVAIMAIGRSKMRFWTMEECNKLPRLSKSLNLEFNEVHIGNSVEATLKQGDFAIEIDATETAMPHINHHVEHGVLFLNLEEVSLEKVAPCPFKVVISAPHLDKISITKGAELRNTETYKTDSLDINAVQGSAVYLSIDVEHLNASASHSAKIEIAGEVRNLTGWGSNSAELQLPFAHVGSVKMSLTNSATAIIDADTIVFANLMNSSELRYIGEAVLEEIDVKNSSSMQKVAKK